MKYATFATFLFSGSAALAHPGHDAALREGVSHWLFSPQHGLAVIAVAAVALVVHAARQKG